MIGFEHNQIIHNKHGENQMTSFHDLLQDIAQQLACEYSQNMKLARQAAGWILEAITGKDEAFLIAHKDIAITKEEQEKLNIWIKKITKNHEPLAYLIGHVPFDDLTLDIKPPILIPRPETEEWVMDLISRLSKLPNQNFSILDIGTGSGCIALALAHSFPQAHITAIDISKDALNLAKHNAQKNNIKNVEFILSNLFEKISTEKKFDIIVANPPYIAPEEWNTLAPSVSNWEDKQALIAEDHGLKLIQEIIEQAPYYLRHNHDIASHSYQNLIIEIGYRQGDAVQNMLKKKKYKQIYIRKDLEKNDRTAQAFYEN